MTARHARRPGPGRQPAEGADDARRDGRVAAVMITYNRRDEARRAVERLLRLPERPPVIVVDNGSTDGTPDALAGSGATVIEAGRNLGAAGRNVGADTATAPYVAFCDDDMSWAPGSLGRAADLLDRHPRLGLVAGRVVVGADGREDPVCTEMARSALRRGPDAAGIPVLGFLAGASMVRRSAFLEVGGFEYRFLVGGEEELLALDLAAGGWELAYVPDVVVRHEPSAQRDASGRRRMLARNALLVATLRWPADLALRRTARVAAGGVRDRAVRRGVLEALGSLPWALRHRRRLPREVAEAVRTLQADG